MLVLTAALAKVTTVTDCDPPRGRISRHRPEHDEVRGQHQQQAPEHGPLAQARRLPAEIEQTSSARAESLDRPRRESEQPQFLGGRRIDGEPISVVGVALRLAHLIGIAIAPHAAFAQQPVRRQPCAREQNRRPPCVRRQHDGGRKPADHLHQSRRDEVHRDAHRRPADPEIEIARHREVGGQARVSRDAPCRAA